MLARRGEQGICRVRQAQPRSSRPAARIRTTRGTQPNDRFAPSGDGDFFQDGDLERSLSPLQYIGVAHLGSLDDFRAVRPPRLGGALNLQRYAASLRGEPPSPACFERQLGSIKSNASEWGAPHS